MGGNLMRFLEEVASSLYYFLSVLNKWLAFYKFENLFFILIWSLGLISKDAVVVYSVDSFGLGLPCNILRG